MENCSCCGHRKHIHLQIIREVSSRGHRSGQACERSWVPSRCAVIPCGPQLFVLTGKGVINFVTGAGKTGQLLASHMKIMKIGFTGSIATGRKVQDAATKSNLKKVTLELGGKSPALIFNDADIENAVAQNSQGFLLNSGQICAAASR
jgi:hypothetical protein